MNIPKCPVRVFLLVQKGAVYLLLGVGWLSGAGVKAQFATITGHVTTEKQLTLSGGEVFVFDPKSHKPVRVPEEVQVDGSYLIEGLRLGTYDFVACALPFDQDKTSGKSRKINSTGLTTINFVLPPRPEGVTRIIQPDSQMADSDGLLYHRDRQTGCVVAQFPRMANGEYKITGIVPGYDLCIRRVGDKEVPHAF